ncbi:MAG TPA: hypothetical protein PLJ04_01770, partial [Candidatus Saccharibacteria bacterium]|nr:hypothetical protein [Candidatus Saccharibacteria bacterium]
KLSMYEKNPSTEKYKTISTDPSTKVTMTNSASRNSNTDKGITLSTDDISDEADDASSLPSLHNTHKDISHVQQIPTSSQTDSSEFSPGIINFQQVLADQSSSREFSRKDLIENE